MVPGTTTGRASCGSIHATNAPPAEPVKRSGRPSALRPCGDHATDPPGVAGAGNVGTGAVVVVGVVGVTLPGDGADAAPAITAGPVTTATSAAATAARARAPPIAPGSMPAPPARRYAGPSPPLRASVTNSGYSRVP